MSLDKQEFKFPHEAENETDQLDIELEDDNVEVVDDTPEEDRNRAPMKEPPADVTDDELAQYSDSVKKRIQHFSKGYHEERRNKEAALREREEAVRLAQALVEENKKLKETQSQSQQVLLEQAKTVVAKELEEAKRNLKAAYEAGDTDKLLDAQEALTSAKMKAERVNNFRPAPVQQEKPVVQPAPQPVKVDSKAAAWQQANTWFGQNDEMTAVALTVHRKLVESGVDPTSDEYYERIDSRVKQLFPDAFTSEKKKTRNVVAPASRSLAPTKIRLTKSQVQIAKRLGLTVEQYARSVAEQMRKENG